ncbi:MAG: 3-phosphoshikimate 1-carboxyvinyltransferase [Magnetococcales bacterium]|nr:3-phosphoshikimate 1-carboxyvinyltransferase [Magnetococcales bacterium]MBF0322345.1 3-phosphoshikimate 1-carboxyvinyltransferase [Magnetococcales bacterium]
MSPGVSLSGKVTPPGDKSISHRAVIFGALAEGRTEVENLLEGEDVLRTLAAFRAMQVDVQQRGPGRWSIDGVGLEGLSEPEDVLDLGNSGTAMRLLTGLLAAQPFLSILNGDASLRRRPMGRVVEPLQRMGARIHGRDHGRLAPLVIHGGPELLPIDYQSPVVSAQVKSAILLAGISTPGVTSVSETAPTRDHTERMLSAFGGEVQRAGLTVSVGGWPTLKAQSMRVPGDFSAAAFPLVACLLTPGSEIRIANVGVNPTRTGLLDMLLAMGAHIERIDERLMGGEPVADLVVRHTPLRGMVVPREWVPLAIDELPIFSVAAALAEGETLLEGAEELRVKESDRIAAMVAGLSRLGAHVEERPDGMRIVGRPQGIPGGATVDSWTDHRVAMSLLVAGLVSKNPVTVTRCDNIATSFPGFVALMQGLGAPLSEGFGS